MALAISQQHFDGHFLILDAFDPTTPVYDSTAEIAALFAVAMLERPGPIEPTPTSTSRPRSPRQGSR